MTAIGARSDSGAAAVQRQSGWSRRDRMPAAPASASRCASFYAKPMALSPRDAGRVMDAGEHTYADFACLRCAAELPDAAGLCAEHDRTWPHLGT